MSKNPKHSPFNLTHTIFWYTFTHFHKTYNQRIHIWEKRVFFQRTPSFSHGGEKFLTLSRERGGGDFRTGNAQSNHFSMIIPAGQSHNFYLPTKIKLIIFSSKPFQKGFTILKLIPKTLKEEKEAKKRFGPSSTVSFILIFIRWKENQTVFFNYFS